MKTFAITIALALATSALACSPAAGNGAQARPTTTTSAELLEGRTFQVQGVLPDGQPITSDLSFARGLFDSSACRAVGYEAAAYTVSRDADAVTFRAQMHGKGKEGVETWAGRVVGQAIDGTVTGADGVAIAFHGNAR